MNYNISNIIAVLVFFGLGVTFGWWLDPIGVTGETIVKAFELILTSSAVIIAGIALYTWKAQIRFTESLRSADNLKVSFKKLLRASRLHWSESIELARDKSKKYDREKLSSYAKQNEAFILYVDAWDNMPTYMINKAKKSHLIPNALQSKLISFFVPINRDNIENFNPEETNIESLYHSLWTSGLLEIKGYIQLENS